MWSNSVLIFLGYLLHIINQSKNKAAVNYILASVRMENNCFSKFDLYVTNKEEIYTLEVHGNMVVLVANYINGECT